MGSGRMRAVALAVCSGVAMAALAAPAEATFPGSNGGIAFAQRTGSGDSAPAYVEHARLVLAPPGRRTSRILIDCESTDGAPSGGDCTGTGYASPSWSADGARLAFDAGARIGVMGAAGGSPVLLPAASPDDGDPAFSPDGTRVVFTGTNDRGTTDLYVRHLAGGPARLIVNDASEPAWSSRGRLAYVRSGNIYTAGPRGGRRRFVTSGVSPDWSPDGRRLLLVRPLPRLVFDAPVGRLHLVGASGGGLRRVGPPDDASHPVWSPDGRSIAYDGFDLGVFQKRIGSRTAAREVAPTQISGESGFVSSFHPAWRPRPR